MPSTAVCMQSPLVWPRRPVVAVALQAEVLDLLKLNVGADVTPGRVPLGISGVEAQAQLKVRLDNVALIPM
ncbi:hypothetical protein ACIHEJ_38210 [Streptomyces sp. NPDC052301]|uniref:hypothetical protein n=1 Tax=Streptomyces sp. NPDC052301 TaxID=3365687 RepID=UPI0037D8FFAD